MSNDELSTQDVLTDATKTYARFTNMKMRMMKTTMSHLMIINISLKRNLSNFVKIQIYPTQQT